MRRQLNLALRHWLRVYDAHPFTTAIITANLILFGLCYGWVMRSPMIAVPTLAFAALWFSLVTGSLFEYLRQALITYLLRQGPPPPGSPGFDTEPTQPR